MIPDQGSLQDSPPVKLMLSLHEAGQTGILYFRQGEMLKVFYLNRGRISWAISSDEADRIDHVLLAKGVVAPEVLAPYQAGNKIAETFGKVLVENGVLPLDALIQATREQVRLIAFSIMRWNSGSYQLAAEPPPNRLVSLDLDVSALAYQYVLGEMDVNIAWEELGSLSGELQRDSDPERSRLYALDAEQGEVLSRFREPQRLESVLLDFPSERKHRVLKVLYFLLLSGMLKKMEAEKAPGIDFKELDSLFGQAQSDPAAEVDIEMPAIIDEAAIQEIPAAETPSAFAAQAEAVPAPQFPELPDLLPDEAPEPAAAPPPDRSPLPEAKARPYAPQFLKPEKQKSRLLSIPLLSVLLLAAMVGAFLWLGRGKAPEEPAAPASLRARPAKGLAAKPDPPRPAVGQAPQGPAAAETEANEAPGAEAAVRDRAAAAQPGGQARAAAASPVNPDPGAGAAADSQARRAYAAGDFRSAGEIWRRAILDARVTHSILLEMDCQKGSVRNAYRQTAAKEDFFLLNRTSRDGRGCWLVLWGRYRSAEEAALGMELVPEYFLTQSNPPSVIELAPYL